MVPFTARTFGRALIMPNLVPPVRTTEDASAYRDQILAAVPEGVAFEPQMTLYLTDNTTPEEIAKAAASGFVRGCKLYRRRHHQLRRRRHRRQQVHARPRGHGRASLVLEVHGEVTHGSVDMFDPRRLFLGRLRKPALVLGARLEDRHGTHHHRGSRGVLQGPRR